MAAPMLVPKAPMDEDSRVVFWKNEIGTSGQITAMQPEAVSELVEEPPDDHFGRSVLALNATHDLRTPNAAEGVHGQRPRSTARGCTQVQYPICGKSTDLTLKTLTIGRCRESLEKVQMSIVETTMKRDFSITVLGRTLEHLGVQMYKRRDTAIAELVANCWDAGAKNVHIHLPKSGAYNQTTSTILIVDDGSGMNPEQIQEQYLVVGRNARRDDSRENPTRPLMGRKGIGKLAGFGLAAEMTVITWQDEIATELTLDVALLKRENGEADRVPIEGIVGELPSFATTPGGTRIVLRKLKHKTPPSIESLRKALSRRFSRRVRGEMIIHVNDEPLGEPLLELENRFPETDYEIAHLEGGGHVRYFYGFAKKPIASGEMRGFTVYVRGKTAQAPPFYFQAEATASGQHATKYMTGEIEADYLDEGTDDESDLISTDRQGIDWESDTLQPFREWGERIVREALREWANRKGDRMEDWISKDAGLNARIQRLDLTSRKQVRKFIRTLGGADAERNAHLSWPIPL